MKRSNGVSVTGIAIHSTAVAALLFFVVPLFMIGNSPADYAFIDFSVLSLAGLLLVIAVSVFLTLICLGVAIWRDREAAMLGLRYLFWWALLAGLLLPVSISAGMTDAAAVGVDLIHLCAVAVLAAVLVRLQRTSAKQYVLAFVVVFLLFTIGTSAWSIMQSDTTRSQTLVALEKPESTTLSVNSNVLVISLDGLQGHVVAELLRDDATTAAAFNDFTLFENTMSQSPATQASMVGELFGVRDYRSLGNSLEEVKEALEDDGLVAMIPLNAAEDAFQKHYPFGRDAGLDQNEAAVTADSVEFLKFALARVATRFAVNNPVSDSTFRLLVEVLAKEGGDELAGRLRNHVGPDWDKRYVAEIHEYDTFTRQLSVSDKSISYRYLHFAFTHYPVDFDERCLYRSDDRRWFDASQNIAGLEKETRCALTKLQALLQKLKTLGIYDESLLVFKSDHGHPTSYFDENPYDLEVNKHNLWGYSRYRPFMMIKPRRASQEQLQVRSDLVMLNDLARTICVHGSQKMDCERIPGQDLLASESVDAGYYLYVVPSRASSFTFESHISVPMASRLLNPVDALSAAQGVELGANGNRTD